MALRNVTYFTGRIVQTLQKSESLGQDGMKMVVYVSKRAMVYTSASTRRGASWMSLVGAGGCPTYPRHDASTRMTSEGYTTPMGRFLESVIQTIFCDDESMR